MVSVPYSNQALVGIPFGFMEPPSVAVVLVTVPAAVVVTSGGRLTTVTVTSSLLPPRESGSFTRIVTGPPAEMPDTVLDVVVEPAEIKAFETEAIAEFDDVIVTCVLVA